MFTGSFWKAAGERAFMTFLQALLGIMLVTGFSPLDANWGEIFLASGFAAAISLLKALVAGAATGTASVTGSEIPSGEVAATRKDGQFVAGPASPIPNDTPVAVTSTYSGDSKSSAAWFPEQGPGDGG